MAAPLSCDHCEALLADYLLRALEPDAVQAVTEHLRTCAHCRAQKCIGFPVCNLPLKAFAGKKVT